ncbi:bifunctional aspartate transaminase/aspartate 4-decarboxylase [Parabacteroides sp. AM58-2XD]|uniref:bifunctional aspartate transaminase/aspartate 4-decarboxylase n=1 Tax=Parabacteroides sp. AM58-2XD TaxID=2292362 RepID=UPI000FE195DF|nr:MULTISPECIES: bifunctional aspartate transaminase/aspartate 4-decarboxylase [Parabacteroides]RGY92880.1 bifunctional aspartate transaminase/aspartate 4-decarboxylase [Parabacteroides sp. AM58-2XD]GKG74663.1 aspartate 4-decarboxylase [Parabacteroides goldsteinii]GKG81931.1 aspartate 4-decarboxylase [Parabacteroides goldsteinii]
MEENNKIVVTREYEKKMSEISPFELKDILIRLADESARKSTHIMLNAGRGNPNWIATTPREAFFLLGQFALEECRRGVKLEDGMVGLAGVPQKPSIAYRFREFLDKHEGVPGSELLRDTYNYMVRVKEVDENDLVHEWAEGVIGDQYPVPDRILKYTEVLVRDYLDQALCNNRPPKGKFDLFATEGGTAAMCYIFDSLQQNFLLNKGDKIVLFAPVFTPYIEIPEQARYLFDVTEIHALKMTGDGYHTWQYQEKDLDVLKDPSVKAAFIVNPSNPPSYALTPGLTERIVDIVTNYNPNLMIITDDVYATYVHGFRSLMAELPDNTLCVYSFSKYFGATGWRLAVISLHEDNIYDRMIAALPDDKKAALAKRYSSIMLDPSKMKFIDRMVADSRQVALNHTSGLSLPQQTQMSLFASFSLLDSENLYQSHMIDIIHERLHTLWKSSGFTLLDDPLRAGYYSEIDMEVWAKKFYGDDFFEYLKANYEPVDVVFRLAQETSLVLLNGGGFDAPEWSIRASLANLKTEDYVRIGEGIASILHSYAAKWQESIKDK